jgi:flagellar basal body-associated protein FliL
MSYYDPSQPAQSQWRHPNAQTQTERQQPLLQPLPQQPTYQQSLQSSQPAQPPQSPKKKARRKLWVVVGVVVALIAIPGVIFVGHSTSSQPAKSTPPGSSKHQHQTTQVVSTPTPQPTLVIEAIGKPVVVDGTWTITVNGVKTSSGDSFSTPGAGDIYLVVDVTVKNTSTHYQDMLSGNQFVLKDSTGQQYRESITDFATPPDGSIKFGEFLRGQLAYEIPATKHAFFYYFQADASGTDLTEWALNI